MLEPYMIDIALEIIKIIVGVSIPVLTIAASVYANKLKRKIERNQLQNEINSRIQWALQAKSFQSMSLEDRTDAIKESISIFMQENNLYFTDIEIQIMIDRAMQSLRELEIIRHKLSIRRKLEVSNANH